MTKDLDTLTLPCIYGLSEVIRWSHILLDIQVMFCPLSTFQHLLVHPKDSVPTEEQKGVVYEVRASQLAQASERVGSPIPASQQGGALVFALKKTTASGRNVGKVFNPVVKLVLENQPFQALCTVYHVVVAPRSTLVRLDVDAAQQSPDQDQLLLKDQPT